MSAADNLAALGAFLVQGMKNGDRLHLEVEDACLSIQIIRGGHGVSTEIGPAALLLAEPYAVRFAVEKLYQGLEEEEEPTVTITVETADD